MVSLDHPTWTKTAKKTCSYAGKWGEEANLRSKRSVFKQSIWSIVESTVSHWKKDPKKRILNTCGKLKSDQSRSELFWLLWKIKSWSRVFRSPFFHLSKFSVHYTDDSQIVLRTILPLKMSFILLTPNKLLPIFMITVWKSRICENPKGEFVCDVRECLRIYISSYHVITSQRTELHRNSNFICILFLLNVLKLVSDMETLLSNLA